MKYPIVTATKENKIKLVESYKVDRVVVPVGFESDGLTLKSRIFRLVVSKYSPKFMPFFIVHDYLCDIGKYKKADEIGEKILFEIEKSIRTKLMITMVKLYHKIKYRNVYHGTSTNTNK